MHLRQTTENKYTKIMKSNLLKILNDLQLNSFSRPTIYNPQTGQINSDYGFAVPIEGTVVVVPDLFDEILRDFLRERGIVLSKPNAWVYVEMLTDGFFKLQVVEIHEDIEVAIKLGVLRNQPVIWWNAKTEDIDLPSPQKTGKDDQIEAYADQVALSLSKQLENA